MSRRLFATALLLLLGITTLRAQEPSEVDLYVYECIKMIDAGEYDKAWEMLETGAERYPDRSVFRYEQAYIRYAQERYGDAKDILEEIVKKPDASDRYYMLLGNAYDMEGHPDKAIETYEKGLELYPESGYLYLELGGMALQREEYDKAVDYWETGLTVQPDYSSNFFHAGRMYAGSSMSGWGLLYGEIFHALEPVTERSKVMREILWAAYDEAIQFEHEMEEPEEEDEDEGTETSRGGISMFKTISMSMSEEGKVLMPLEMYVELSTIVAATPLFIEGPPLTIAKLHALRSAFLDQWYTEKTGAAAHFNVTLFDYQRRMKEAGVFEAYDHLLFWCEATNDEFEVYIEAHPDAFAELGAWFEANPYPADVNPLSRLTVVGKAMGDDGGVKEE